MTWNECYEEKPQVGEICLIIPPESSGLIYDLAVFTGSETNTASVENINISRLVFISVLTGIEYDPNEVFWMSIPKKQDYNKPTLSNMNRKLSMENSGLTSDQLEIIGAKRVRIGKTIYAWQFPDKSIGYYSFENGKWVVHDINSKEMPIIPD